VAIPSRPSVVRLPGELVTRFDALCAEYKGLQRSAVLRMLLGAALQKPLDEQVRIVDAMIKGKKSDKPHSRSALNRVSKD
jgi:hypothetical protein